MIYPVDSAIQRLNNRDLALAYILSSGSIDHQGKGGGERRELSLCDIPKTAVRETKGNWA